MIRAIQDGTGAPAQPTPKADRGTKEQSGGMDGKSWQVWERLPNMRAKEVGSSRRFHGNSTAFWACCSPCRLFGSPSRHVCLRSVRLHSTFPRNSNWRDGQARTGSEKKCHLSRLLSCLKKSLLPQRRKTSVSALNHGARCIMHCTLAEQ
jgi:hypothetical protein